MKLPGSKRTYQIGVADGLDDFQRVQLSVLYLFSQRHQFQGDGKSAGSNCLPYFAKVAAPQPPDQLITGHRLAARSNVQIIHIGRRGLGRCSLFVRRRLPGERAGL